MKLSYQNALRAEVHGFSESIKNKLERSKKEQELVITLMSRDAETWLGISQAPK